LLKLAGLARSTFYYQQKTAQAEDKHEALKRQIGTLHLRYLLRTAFLPPAALREAIVQGYEGFMQGLHDLFCARLAHRFLLEASEVSMYADAYLGIVDSLHVELVYGNEAAFERRLAALWRVLSLSLAQAPAARTNG